MSDHWDFYALRVDDQPASIFVDLGIHPWVPMKDLPYSAYVRIFMCQPKPDGLSSSDEFDALIAIEDALESRLCSDSVQYVGRNTSNGCRDFFFYVASQAAWATEVADALSAFGSYTYECGSREDPDWRTYLDFLFPGPLSRQRIDNRHVCEALESHGDPLLVAREIDHWCYFPDETSAAAYLAEVEALGFQVRARHSSDADSPEVGAQVWRMDVPSHENINEVTLPLFEAASRHGGRYDGWECRVEA